MRPSVTSRGVAWIEQFEVDDRPAAAALIDSMRFASADEVLGGVKATLESLIASGSARHPVAIFPVLAQEDLRCTRVDEVLPERPIAFEDFDPSQPLDAAPGSEALMANLVREVARGLSGDQVVRQQAGNPISLERLCAARVRTLIFVTDYIGSGKQVVDYVEAWHRNPTIRSWMSFGWVKVVVTAFASTQLGLDCVRSIARPPETLVTEVAPSLADLAERVQAQEVVQLCANYAKRARLSMPPLGFRESGGLFVSALSVPNNLPAILLESRRGRWKALFEHRHLAAELSQEIGSFVPERDLAHELALARRVRLADRFKDRQVSTRWISRLAVLALLPASDDEVALTTGYPLGRVRSIRASLRALGLIDVDGRHTPQGRLELSMAGRKTRVISAGLQGSSEPYYPRLTR